MRRLIRRSDIRILVSLRFGFTFCVGWEAQFGISSSFLRENFALKLSWMCLFKQRRWDFGISEFVFPSPRIVLIQWTMWMIQCQINRIWGYFGPKLFICPGIVLKHQILNRCSKMTRRSDLEDATVQIESCNCFYGGGCSYSNLAPPPVSPAIKLCHLKS